MSTQKCWIALECPKETYSSKSERIYYQIKQTTADEKDKCFHLSSGDKPSTSFNDISG